MKKHLAIAIFMVLPILFAHAQSQTAITPPTAEKDNSPRSPEINTALMESTFLFEGPSARVGEENEQRFGTGFIMLRRIKPDSDLGQYVLVTAKHVFEDIRGDDATLILRKRDADGNIIPFPYPVKIREKGQALYKEHPSADVAAIDITLPTDSIVAQTEVTNIDWLATDDFLESINIHPGDELLCLGYPLGLSANDAGYPILRGGRIASYPIVPFEKSGPILYDFQAQAGNSGGPVYFAFQGRSRKGHLAPFGTTMTYQKIIGLVTEKHNPVGNIDPSIAIIVPSVYIKETLDLLAGFESTIKDDDR